MNNWLLSLLLGILAIIMGFVALANPIPTLLALDLFIGWSFIILGIVVVISAFTGNESNGKIWTVLLGVLMFITGIIMLRNPVAGVGALAIFAGITFIVSGIVKFFAGWKIQSTSLKWLTIISGIASFVLGILVFKNPFASLAILFALELIFDGIALCVLAFARKSGGVQA